MKKIFAILTSLLFVVSVFGVASVVAIVYQCDGAEIVIPSSVQVGDYFIYKSNCTTTHSVVGGGVFDDYVLPGEILPMEGDYFVVRHRTLKPGTLQFCPCDCAAACRTITILPKEYPMASFMKILGLGQQD